MAGNLVGLLEKIVTSTPNTMRTVVMILLVIGAIVGGLWLLKANLTAGPISVVGREDSAAIPALCGPGSSTEGVSHACGR